MSSAPFVDPETKDSSAVAAGSTSFSGQDKRTAFKNRWLNGGKSTTVAGGTASEAVSLTDRRAVSSNERSFASRNRWLKGLLTSNAAAKCSVKCVDAVSHPATADVNPDEVCLMSDSPYYALTVCRLFQRTACTAILNVVAVTGSKCSIGILHHRKKTPLLQ